MLVIGSDSHTCSSGAVGCLSIGLGAADVTMGLITGELLMKVPEVVNIEFVGRPKRGIGGKDVILYVLQQLKRNTVAADRVVEYTGPGLAYLSPDARFAIANMTTVRHFPQLWERKWCFQSSPNIVRLLTHRVCLLGIRRYYRNSCTRPPDKVIHRPQKSRAVQELVKVLPHR